MIWLLAQQLWAINLAGVLLILLYVTAFTFWVFGFALLARQILPSGARPKN